MKTKFKAISTRLFQSDVSVIKKQAEKEGVAWQTKLRNLVHWAIRQSPEQLYIWKFIIKDPTPIPSNSPNSEFLVSCCLAVAVAATEGEARRKLEAAALEFGADVRWLGIAQVVKMDVVPSFIGWHVG